MSVDEKAKLPEETSTQPKKNNKKRNIWLIVIAAVFILAGLLWFLYWVFIGRFYVNTDDAYVHGNEVFLTPQVASSVKAIYADDTDLVKEGQLIVELDPTDYQMAYDENVAQLAFTVREVAQLFENVKEQEATIELRLAELTLYELELEHREGLVGTHAISLEDYETAQTNVLVAAADLELAEAMYESALLLVEGTTVATHPEVKLQAAMLRESYINLLRCKLYAPVTGYIAKRSVQVGEQVNAGDELLMVVPLYDLWLEANYKETKLRNIRIGQKVTVTADIYGGSVKYYGSVVGFSPGTGDAFALLPPQNASGNWIKIIQRLPVRVSFDRSALEEHPLMIGLSLHVSVDVHDTSGKMLSPVPVDGYPIYTTDIFDWDVAFETVDYKIDQIIAENGP